MKLACKPGSVRSLRPCGSHSSGPTVTCRLERPTREQREQRYRSPIWSCSGWGFACRPCYHVRGELLPRHFNLACASRPSAVYFLFHFPAPHGVRPLAGILLCGARTFLCKCKNLQRLPSQLHALSVTLRFLCSPYETSHNDLRRIRVATSSEGHRGLHHFSRRLAIIRLLVDLDLQRPGGVAQSVQERVFADRRATQAALRPDSRILVETAKGYMKHERETLEAVIAARNAGVYRRTESGIRPARHRGHEGVAGLRRPIVRGAVTLHGGERVLSRPQGQLPPCCNSVKN